MPLGDGVLALPGESSRWRERDHRLPRRNSRSPQYCRPSSPRCSEGCGGGGGGGRGAPLQNFVPEFSVDQPRERLRSHSVSPRGRKDRLSVSISEDAVDGVENEGEGGHGKDTETGIGSETLPPPPPPLSPQRRKGNSHAKLDLLLAQVEQISGRLDSIMYRLAALEETGRDESSGGAGTTRATIDSEDADLESKEGLQ